MARILIIDDEPAIRGLLGLQLGNAGHTIIEAAHGIEGLAMAEEQAPDLIFLDGMIPKIDGWQVCKRLKGNAKTNHIPVVMLTTCNEKIEEMRGWESGVNEYLTKPWLPAQVLEVTTRLLGTKTGTP
jgi:CheY-like chemotaxis protein